MSPSSATKSAPDGTHTPTSPTANDILTAADRIKGRVMRTPLVRAEKLSAITGVNLWLKLENLQYTGAFKERGALNKLLTMSKEERAIGVIAASAGNHAQGLAFHARALGAKATIVMPTTTPDVKVRQTRELGADIVLHGLTFDDARSHAEALQKEKGFIFVHPFDDPSVIAGQGTIALEMIEDGPAFDTIIVPIGGGGLIAGMATSITDRSPDTKIIGVQAALFPSMANALDNGTRAVGGNSLAEGIAVNEAGFLTRQIVKDAVSDIILVEERILERALSLLMNEQKILAEGAGAAGLAAILTEPDRFKGQNVGLVICGGNIDARLLSMILMRDLARAGRLARLRVSLLDMPGQLVRVASIIASQDGNVDTQGKEHLDRIIANLTQEGYEVEIAAY